MRKYNMECDFEKGGRIAYASIKEPVVPELNAIRIESATSIIQAYQG